MSDKELIEELYERIWQLEKEKLELEEELKKHKGEIKDDRRICN